MNHQEKFSHLHIVAISIGNHEDISPRALKTLAAADLIAAEDTRKAGLLLQKLGIKPRALTRYYDHKEEASTVKILRRMTDQPLNVALISDAGTPCISDPGFKLIREAKKAGIPVTPVPGPSAPIALASAAGLPTDRLMFIGFLPRKENALIAEIKSWAQTGASVICFESALRLQKTLGTIAELLPSAEVAMGRELTKTYEEIITLDIATAQKNLKSRQAIKGEVTLMIHPNTPEAPAPNLEELKEKIAICRRHGMSHRDMRAVFSHIPIEKKHLYRLLLGSETD